MYQGLLSRKQIRKMLRYFIIFLAVFISSQYIPECSISYSTAFIMAAIASITFCIIDMYFPLIKN